MQSRMQKHQLTEKQICELLASEKVGAIATMNEDGTPYVVPVHFAFEDGKVFFHGLPKGRKIDNIRRNPSVALTVWRMDSLLPSKDGSPCNVNTKYESVCINGKARILDDFDQKLHAFQLIVSKYTPELADREIPQGAVRGTAVVEVSCEEITGKFYADVYNK